MQPTPSRSGKKTPVIAAIAILAILLAILLILYVVPFGHTHTVGIFFAAAELTHAGQCVTTDHSESFPSWFVGSAAMNWTASGGAVALWINESGRSGSTTVYSGSGTQGSGGFSIESATPYAFEVQNCNPEQVTLNVTISVPYSSPIL